MSPVLGVVPFSSEFEGDRLFTEDPRINRDDALRPWRRVRQVLEERGWQVGTWDTIHTEPTVWLHLDCFHPLATGVDPRRTVVMLLEPEVVAPLWYDLIREGSVDVAQIHLQDRELVAGAPSRRYVPYPQSLPFSVPDRARDLPLVMINGRKYPARRRDELYSEREHVAAWFADRDAIAIYGGGWDRRSWRHPASAWRTGRLRRAWHGRVDSKFDVLARSVAALCFENMRCPGYHTEKLFDAMAAGAVPVYYGDPTISEVVDPRSFIDYASVDGPLGLCERLRSMNVAETDDIREAGRLWLASEEFVPYLPETFASRLAGSIEEVADGR